MKACEDGSCINEEVGKYQAALYQMQLEMLPTYSLKIWLSILKLALIKLENSLEYTWYSH